MMNPIVEHLYKRMKTLESDMKNMKSNQKTLGDDMENVNSKQKNELLNVFSRGIQRAQTSVSHLSDAIDNLRKQLSKEQEKIKQLEKQISLSRETSDRVCEQQQEGKINNRLQQLTNEIENLRKEVKNPKEIWDAICEQDRKSKSYFDQLSNEIANLGNGVKRPSDLHLEKLNEICDTITVQENKAKTRYKQVTNEMGNLRTQIGSDGRLKQLSNEIANLRKNILHEKTKNMQIPNLIQILQREICNGQNQRKSQEGRIIKLENQLNELLQRLKSFLRLESEDRLENSNIDYGETSKIEVSSKPKSKLLCAKPGQALGTFLKKELDAFEECFLNERLENSLSGANAINAEKVKGNETLNETIELIQESKYLNIVDEKEQLQVVHICEQNCEQKNLIALEGKEEVALLSEETNDGLFKKQTERFVDCFFEDEWTKNSFPSTESQDVIKKKKVKELEKFLINEDWTKDAFPSTETQDVVINKKAKGFEECFLDDDFTKGTVREKEDVALSELSFDSLNISNGVGTMSYLAKAHEYLQSLQTEIIDPNDDVTKTVTGGKKAGNKETSADARKTELKDRLLKEKIEWGMRKDTKSPTPNLYNSPVFYTGNPGYRVQLRAKIDREYGHIYFSGRLLQGVFDEKLEWPCKLRFNIELSDKMNMPIYGCWTLPFDVGENILRRPSSKKADVISEYLGPFDIKTYVDMDVISFDISMI